MYYIVYVIQIFMFQLTVAVRGSTSKSLVLIDEFGSSTYQFDGASLLVSTIDFWTSQVEAASPRNLNESTLLSGGEFKKALVTHQPLTEDIILRGCPLVFASTHFYKLHDFFQNPNNVRKLVIDFLFHKIIAEMQTLHAQLLIK